ncbi:MAG: dTMP kinase [Candidatus Tantalella remota]|nr:dTMP kinase [Candidatus Tantalella remota]
MAKELTRGIFITLEGPEGSGKSTQSASLCDDLIADGYQVVHTAQPGGTELGSKIRDILLQKDNIHLGEKAELFLFEADRAQHVEEMIRPALKDRKIVICDRFNTATFAYQGYGLGMDMSLIETVDNAATGGLVPDLTLLMDLDVKTGLKRALRAGAADRMEKRGNDFHTKVRQGYLELAAKYPERIKVISVREKIGDTYELVKKEVYSLIEKVEEG